MKCMDVFVLCVMCMCTWPGICLCPLLDMQVCGLSCDGICLIALCWSVLLCEVLCLSYVLLFLHMVMFWHLVMLSLVGTVMIHTFPSLFSLYYFTILVIFHIALAPFPSVLPLLAIVPAF